MRFRRSSTPRSGAASARSLGLAWLLLAAGAGPAAALELRISELLYDAAGADQGRVFLELYGAPGLDLTGFSVEGVNGANGSVVEVVPLSGVIPADGFFVIAGTSGGVTEVPNADLERSFDFQNGPDSVVLRGPGAALLDALGYGAFGSGEVFAGEGQPAPDAPPGSSLARLLANLDTDNNAADFGVLSLPTPGTGPVGAPVPEPRAWVLVLVGSAALRRALRGS
ncbi:MAG: lamin tail domain-containing protein [Myxococcales bacterium]|nr:lamin tail domain-containing protein [Myxococcales bacterium]